jgi:hypothetical protein
VRRSVRDRVAASLEYARLSLEKYVSERLRYPEAFPCHFSRPVVGIREVRELKIAPLMNADHPPVRIDALIRASLANRVSQVRDGYGPGVLDVDVQLTAQGTVHGDGTYAIAPQAAVLKAWWRDMAPGRGRSDGP